MAITGGVNWIDLLPPLTDVHWIWTLLMLFYIAFAARLQIYYSADNIFWMIYIYIHTVDIYYIHSIFCHMMMFHDNCSI